MFDKKTFTYLNAARKNEMDIEWFEKNKKNYLEFVKKPMSELVVKVWEKFEDDLPGIKIDPSRISRPTRMRKNNPENKPVVKSESSFYFAVPPTSRFEWNPGFYFQISPEADGIVLGVGLYMISSRQTKLMRRAITNRFDEFDKILSNPTLKRRFGGLTGETYQRYPRGLDENDRAKKYLIYKNFHLVKHYTKEDVLDKNFAKTFIKDMTIVMPFFKWVRETAGVYKKEDKFYSGEVNFMSQDDF